MLQHNHACNWQCRFQQHGLPVSKGSRFDEKGNMVEQAAPTARSAVRDAIAAHVRMTQKYRKTSFILGWHEIRHLLYQALPESAVVFDKQVKVVFSTFLASHLP